MAENTKIEWADATVNHWAGCTKVSPACDHCYAERMAKRLWGIEWGAGQPRKQYTSSRDMLEALDRKARRLGRPMRVFHNSLSDFFDNEVPGAWRAKALQAMKDTPNLIHLLLTKRIGNASSMLDEAVELMDTGMGVWAPSVFKNVWIGATVVNQEEADRDIPKLLAVPAEKRFLSIEPLLGAIDLRNLNSGRETNEFDCLAPDICDVAIKGWTGTSPTWEEDFEEWFGVRPESVHPGDPMHKRIDWVIVGGESGPGARPIHPEWARSIRDQCVAAGVAFFFKQWGEYALNWLNDDAGHKIRGSEWMDRMGKRASGRLLDGRTWDEVPTP